MEFLVGGFLILVVGIIVLKTLADISLPKAFSAADQEYMEALDALGEDPNNPALWKAALQKGRARAELSRALAKSRKGSNMMVFDETALRNDIDAVTVGRSVKFSHADEMRKLATLEQAGVITRDDLESLESKLAGKPNEVMNAIRLLDSLKDLEREGLLSASELELKARQVFLKNGLRD